MTLIEIVNEWLPALTYVGPPLCGWIWWSANQRFAKWYLCGERRVPEDGREPRPNLIFQLGDQTEKVVYDDWNGVAAYKEQFNKNFRAEG